MIGECLAEVRPCFFLLVLVVEAAFVVNALDGLVDGCVDVVGCLYLCEDAVVEEALVDERHRVGGVLTLIVNKA